MATPVRVNTGAGGSIQNSDPISFSLNVGTGNNRCVFIGLVVLNTTTTDSITCTVGGASASLEQIGSVGDSAKCYVFRCRQSDGLGTGSLTVQINGSDSSWRGAAWAVPYEDVDQTTPNGTIATAAGVGTAPAATVSSNADDLQVAWVGFREVSTVSAEGTGQASLGSATSSNSPGGVEIFCSEEAGGASFADWTLGVSMGWSVVGLAVKGASGAAALVADTSYYIPNVRVGW